MDEIGKRNQWHPDFMCHPCADRRLSTAGDAFLNLRCRQNLLIAVALK